MGAGAWLPALWAQARKLTSPRTRAAEAGPSGSSRARGPDCSLSFLVCADSLCAKTSPSYEARSPLLSVPRLWRGTQTVRHHPRPVWLTHRQRTAAPWGTGHEHPALLSTCARPSESALALVLPPLPLSLSLNIVSVKSYLLLLHFRNKRVRKLPSLRTLACTGRQDLKETTLTLVELTQQSRSCTGLPLFLSSVHLLGKELF